MPTTDPQQINQVLTRGVAEILPDKKTLAELMTQRPIRLYLGIDPTGAFLHLGHAVALRKLQQFAQLGHEVILLVGSGTVKIGDPTGRDESRPMLTDEQIQQNFKNWKQQAQKVLDFDLIEIRYNGDWLDQLTFVDMVKLMAQTTVQQLLERDMFQRRMANEQPIHAHEIMYPLLQGYDSVAMDVDLEIGGTDQTFNMMMGRHLQKIYNSKPKWVLTTPIIEGTDGRKMSKSFNNFVALIAQPVDMFGKLMSLSDDLILRYFRLLTDIPLKKIDQMEQAIADGANPMQFKKQLAFEITNDLHDQQAAEHAQREFERAFQKGQTPAEVKVVTITQPTIQLLSLLTQALPDTSNSQLRRLCQQGAVRLMPAETKLTDPFADVEFESGQVIKVGKKEFFKVEVKK